MAKAVLSSIRQGSIIVLITLVLIGCIEFGLRLFFTPGSETVAYKFHPKYLVKLAPNAEIEHQRSMINGGELILSETNVWGFRGEFFQQDTDEIRGIVYGDSNIQAIFSAYENTFVARLESELEARTGARFQVINAGVAGYGPDQIMLRIEDELPIWKPDFVIVHVFADNDFGDILRNRLVYFSEGNTDIENRGIPIAERFLIYVEQLYIVKAFRRAFHVVQEATGVRLLNSEPAMTHEEASNLDSLKRRIGEEYGAYLEWWLPRPAGKRNPGSDHYDLDIALDPDSASSQIKLKLMDRILGRIHQTVKGKVPIIFLIQPSVKDISTNNRLHYKDLEKLSDKYRRDNLVHAIEVSLNRIEADYINLFNTFVTNGRTPYYFLTDDNHWNDQGQDLAAKLMAEHLLNRYELVTIE